MAAHKDWFKIVSVPLVSLFLSEKNMDIQYLLLSAFNEFRLAPFVGI
jgi:hypothetical protein